MANDNLIAIFDDIFDKFIAARPFMKGKNEIKSYLIRNGYFDAPASANHHGTMSGDLFFHSLAVARTLTMYTDKMKLTWQNGSSPWVVGLFHDLCKIDSYKKKDDGDDTWEYNKIQTLKGHGEKSVMLLSQLMVLTEEEIMCIRYHMGAYVTDDWESFDRAIREYPNVLFTHTADMHASKIIGI